MKKISIFLFALLSLAMVSCGEDYLETAPTGSVAEKDMIASLSGAETVLDGINRATYTFYSAHDRFGQKSIDYINDCLGDDFYPTEEGYGWFVAWYQWITHRSATAANLEWVWAYYYDLINNANLVLANVEPMQVLAAEEAKKNNIMAQCYTYRAYSLYNLVQYFGEGTKGVPVPLTPNPGALARSTVDSVYLQINNDLTKAINLFTTGGGSTVSRANVSQINAEVAYAIAARVALTRGNWADAAAYAEKAYAKHKLCEDYTYGWNKANSEWIWGAILIDEQQTSYASFFSHMDPFFGGYCSLGNHHIMSEDLFNFLSNGDARKIVNQPDVYYAPYFAAYFLNKPRSSFKYTGMGEWTNDYLYIKSGEMYIIAAEAYARLGQDAKAQNALNTLNNNRFVAGFVPTTKTGDELLEEILMYRRAELWGDGQRFFDMKRLNIGCEGRAGQPLAEQTASIPAGDKRFTFLIPQQEMDSNPKMVQNTL